MFNANSRNGESREERLARVLQGANSLLLQDVRADYDNPVIWCFLTRADRHMKYELLDELGGQAYDLLQLREDQILTNRFQICMWDGELPPLAEEVAAAREMAEEPEEPRRQSCFSPP